MNMSREISCKCSAPLFRYRRGSKFGPLAQLTTAAALWLCSSALTELNRVDHHPHTHTHTGVDGALFPPLTSWRRKGLFPLTFCLRHKHLFPPSCYCGATQEIYVSRSEKCGLVHLVSAGIRSNPVLSNIWEKTRSYWFMNKRRKQCRVKTVLLNLDLLSPSINLCSVLSIWFFSAVCTWKGSDRSH